MYYYLFSYLHNEFLSHLDEADCNSRVNSTITVSFTEMGKELIAYTNCIIIHNSPTDVAAANISAHYTTGFKTDKPTIFQAIQATDIAALLSTVSSSNNAASITTIQATKLSAI